MSFKVRSKKSPAGSGIRGQLVLGFTIFSCVILLIIWVFQVLLLDKFYELTKLSEMKSVINTIEASIDAENVDDVCSELASKYDVCITLYSVQDGSLAQCVATKEVSPTCVIHYADKGTLNQFYLNALNSGEIYTQRYNLNSEQIFFSDGKIRNPERFDESKGPRPFGNQAFSVIAVSVKSISDNNGNEYAAFINLRFTPVSAVQQTRNMQFVYITGGVILFAVFFALLLSFKIARPLEIMTRSAVQIANGDYSVEFKEEGCRETKRLARTLNYAVDQISKTDNLQRELIANVSHDLRTPLTLISGYSEMMRDIPGENTPENSQIIIDETKRLTTLVNDMLDYSKYSTGFESPKFEVFNLTESVTKTLTRYNELVRLDGYNIEFVSDRTVNIFADERMILQVLYNLINNAVNYTGEDKRVKIVQGITDNGMVRISIFDSGHGIPYDELTDIWDRYYKVDKTHKRAVTGSGLGLSIVRRLLQLHSASFGVESTVGSGSCFWFELPLVE